MVGWMHGGRNGYGGVVVGTLAVAGRSEHGHGAGVASASAPSSVDVAASAALRIADADTLHSAAWRPSDMVRQAAQWVAQS